MDSDDRVPLRLRGKKGVVFGNLEDIYEFHNEYVKLLRQNNRSTYSYVSTLPLSPSCHCIGNS